jgi:hypothetical protein
VASTGTPSLDDRRAGRPANRRRPTSNGRDIGNTRPKSFTADSYFGIVRCIRKPCPNSVVTSPSAMNPTRS